MGLGSASVIGLAEARELAHGARKLLARGIAPMNGDATGVISIRPVKSAITYAIRCTKSVISLARASPNTTPRSRKRFSLGSGR